MRVQRPIDPAILGFIRSQPEAVRQAARAAAELRAPGPGSAARTLLALGCGTSYHAAALARSAGAAAAAPRVRAMAAYEAWQHEGEVADVDWVLAVSHSGATDATLGAIETVRRRTGAPVLAITCHRQSRLAQAADEVLVVPAADETVGPKTKGFTASAAALLTAVGIAGGARDAVEAAERAALAMERVLAAPPDAFASLVRRSAEARQLWLLGAGPLQAVAREGALKIVEMAGLPARAIEQEEFIHGWRRGTGPDHLVVALAPAGADTPRLAQVGEMCAAQGARLAVVQAAGAPGLAGVDLRLELPLDTAPDAWQALPYALPIQILAYTLAAPDGGGWA